ncbi:MAG: hypothetical protein EOP42_17520 [Sphingobacteriaceae bacterium]|nr:MAG: hypothetical protein EOP42_17520 [Sphingobacteriaceae bacterium]
MYNLYVGKNYPQKYGTAEIIEQLAVSSTIVTEPDSADFFLFPITYEKLYGYTEHEYNHFNYTKTEINNLRNEFTLMVELASKYNKKIILFYYYDPVKKIEVPNAIVFRTSLLQSKKDHNEFAMPAYGDDLRTKKQIEETNFYLLKTALPSVGFRGQSAPLKLPTKLQIKRKINQLFGSFNITKPFNLHYNFGYLARRDALVSCIQNKNVHTDFSFTTMEQSWDPVNGKLPFVNNVFNNQYNICVSGHGNYSFRLYEILSAGRIPVFINTDCVLPFEEFIDWKKHVVWIEEKDAIKTAECLLEFHQSKSAEDFLHLQQSNRKLWEQYFSKNGFYQSLHQYFPLLNK